MTPDRSDAAARRLRRDVVTVRRSLDGIACVDPAARHLADVIALTRHTLDCVWGPVLDAMLETAPVGAVAGSAEESGRRQAVDLHPAHEPSEPARR